MLPGRRRRTVLGRALQCLCWSTMDGEDRWSIIAPPFTRLLRHKAHLTGLWRTLSGAQPKR